MVARYSNAKAARRCPCVHNSATRAGTSCGRLSGANIHAGNFGGRRFRARRQQSGEFIAVTIQEPADQKNRAGNQHDLDNFGQPSQIRQILAGSAPASAYRYLPRASRFPCRRSRANRRCRRPRPVRGGFAVSRRGFVSASRVALRSRMNFGASHLAGASAASAGVDVNSMAASDPAHSNTPSAAATCAPTALRNGGLIWRNAISRSHASSVARRFKYSVKPQATKTGPMIAPANAKAAKDSKMARHTVGRVGNLHHQRKRIDGPFVADENPDESEETDLQDRLEIRAGDAEPKSRARRAVLADDAAPLGRHLAARAFQLPDRLIQTAPGREQAAPGQQEKPAAAELPGPRAQRFAPAGILAEYLARQHVQRGTFQHWPQPPCGNQQCARKRPKRRQHRAQRHQRQPQRQPRKKTLAACARTAQSPDRALAHWGAAADPIPIYPVASAPRPADIRLK